MILGKDLSWRYGYVFTYLMGVRFAGELFGLGTNHTKYKSKGTSSGSYSASSSTTLSGVGNGSNVGVSSMLSGAGSMSGNGIAGLGLANQMQYGGGHFGGSALHHSTSGYGLYEESQHMAEGY